jgi:SAM-dependent methyltransferase
MAEYHQYIYDLNNRKIIGDFDGAYRECEDVWPNQHFVNTARHRLIRSYIESLGSGIKLLDIGCGYGDFVADLDQRGIDARGCDISPTAIEKARMRHPPGTRLDVGDLSVGLPYPDDEFDMVVSLGLFGFFLDKMESALQEIIRMLKPGGYLSLSVHIPEDPIGQEFIKDYNQFYNVVRGPFDIVDALLIYDSQDIADGQPLDRCKDSLFLICRKKQS